MRTESGARVPRRVATRRAEILEAARALFNAHGTAAVSTNRIAAAAGVSPGNLYYWFPDKPAVIRALFEDWSGVSMPPAPESSDPAAALRALFASVAAQPSVSGRFAFFSRELVALLHADPGLAEAYRHNYEVKTRRIEAGILTLIAAGLLHDPTGHVELRDAVVSAWITSESAPAFLELVEPQAGPERSRAVATAVLRALLTDEGERALRETGAGHA